MTKNSAIIATSIALTKQQRVFLILWAEDEDRSISYLTRGLVQQEFERRGTVMSKRVSERMKQADEVQK